VPQEPRRPGSRPSRAAGIESGLEHRLDTRPQPKSQALARLRQQREVERVCRIPRLVAELLDEIGRHHGIEDDIAARLKRYADLDRGLLAALGADRFPAPPVHVVGGAQ
jgi:hypothetical protein